MNIRLAFVLTLLAAAQHACAADRAPPAQTASVRSDHPPSTALKPLPQPVIVALDTNGHVASPPARFEPGPVDGSETLPAPLPHPSPHVEIPAVSGIYTPPGASANVGDIPRVSGIYTPPSAAMRKYTEWDEPFRPGQGGAITLILSQGPLQQLPGVVVPPRPLRPAQSYLRAADYPHTPLARKLHARVGVLLGVDRTGRVTDCGIQRTSGSVWLDSASCLVLTKRARFVPAKDVDGHAVSGNIIQDLEWKRP